MASGGIPLDWLVDVTSSGVSDSFSLSKLPAILITKYNSELPQDRYSQFYSYSGVLSDFGSGDVSKFASNYFGFTSKKSTKADLLTIFTWNESDTPCVLKGAKCSSLSELKKLNGAFSITIGGTTKDISVDLSDSASYSDVASKIKTAMQTDFSGADCTYSSVTGGFIIKTSETGSSASIDFITSPSSGTDISGALGLKESDGALIISGQSALSDLSSVLSEIESNNGAFFVITFDFEFSDYESDIETLGSFVNNSNNRFLALYLSSETSLKNSNSATSSLTSYNGLMLEYKVSDNQNGLSAGIIASIDFSQENGNFNIAFNDASEFADDAITSETTLENLESNLVNSIFKFGKLGQFETWYGMGNILGSLTNSANVYIANAYLTFQLQFQIANMFSAQSMIGLRGKNNEGLIRSYVDSVFSGCVLNGTIVEGAELTTTEEQSVISTFATNADSAVSQLQSVGYYYEISSIDLVNKSLTLTSAYVANTPAKKIIINNYILGA